MADNDAAAARITMLAQYAKDVSFENPNAPRSLQPLQPGTSPRIDIQVNVNGDLRDDGNHEVTLTLEGTAKAGEDLLFAFSLTYGGLLRLEGIPEEHVRPTVMIEGPRLLFPFARRIIADVVRDGGYPPLYVDPIDFQGLYARGSDPGPAPAGVTH